MPFLINKFIYKHIESEKNNLILFYPSNKFLHKQRIFCFKMAQKLPDSLSYFLKNEKRFIQFTSSPKYLSFCFHCPNVNESNHLGLMFLKQKKRCFCPVVGTHNK